MTSTLKKLVVVACVAFVFAPTGAEAAEFCVYSQTMGVDPYSITTPEVCIPLPPPPTP